MPRPLQLLVLTEDTGENGWKTAREIIRKLLSVIDPSAPLWQDEGRCHGWIDPRNETAFDAMGANRWRSHALEDVERNRQLQRAVATRLLEHDTVDGSRRPVGFVLFHHDGDAPWSRHPDCTMCVQFRKWLSHLEAMLRAHVAQKSEFAQQDANAVVASAMSRLFAVEPHWSIEAWLYGKSLLAAGLCAEHHRGQHDGPAAPWRLTRDSLEEAEQPKDSCCLHDRFNLELARRFDAHDACGSSPSFTALVEAVLGNSELMQAIGAASGGQG